jgi:hypothetical protein
VNWKRQLRGCMGNETQNQRKPVAPGNEKEGKPNQKFSARRYDNFADRPTNAEAYKCLEQETCECRHNRELSFWVHPAPDIVELLPRVLQLRRTKVATVLKIRTLGRFNSCPGRWARSSYDTPVSGLPIRPGPSLSPWQLPAD